MRKHYSSVIKEKQSYDTLKKDGFTMY